MGRSTRRKLLVGVLVAQVAVLLGITALHGVRIADGTEVQLEVVPLDPLDLARGAYVELRYEELEGLDVPGGLEDGDEVYVELERPRSAGDAWTSGDVAASPEAFADPDAYLQLSVQQGEVSTVRIGTYYASAEEAQRLERELVDGGIATLVLDGDGAPLLDEVRG